MNINRLLTSKGVTMKEYVGTNGQGEALYKQEENIVCRVEIGGKYSTSSNTDIKGEETCKGMLITEQINIPYQSIITFRSQEYKILASDEGYDIKGNYIFTQYKLGDT